MTRQPDHFIELTRSGKPACAGHVERLAAVVDGKARALAERLSAPPSPS